MVCLILLLTSANYFNYPSADNRAAIEFADAESEKEVPSQSNPAGPDEKSPNAPVSFNEEYVHKQDGLHDPYWTNFLFEYMIQQTEKLDHVHFEILSPPPEVTV